MVSNTRISTLKITTSQRSLTIITAIVTPKNLTQKQYLYVTTTFTHFNSFATFKLLLKQSLPQFAMGRFYSPYYNYQVFFKGSTYYVQRGHPNVVTKADMIPQTDETSSVSGNRFQQLLPLHTPSRNIVLYTVSYLPSVISSIQVMVER